MHFHRGRFIDTSDQYGSRGYRRRCSRCGRFIGGYARTYEEAHLRRCVQCIMRNRRLALARLQRNKWIRSRKR